ncbi:MAG: hypothetical protein KC482_01340 [Dehalococcoidia bacterium]|nr:hypothetical protein [Dehalococcoidia bacterium]
MVASYSHWQYLEQCVGCRRLIDTNAEDYSVIVTTLAQRRYWCRNCFIHVLARAGAAPPEAA